MTPMIVGWGHTKFGRHENMSLDDLIHSAGREALDASMVVCMKITDPLWGFSYFAEVPKILAEYSGVSIARSRQVTSLEGSTPPSNRMAVLSFPSLEAITAFMQDARYQSYRKTRERGARTDIFVFENGVVQGELV